MEQESWSNFLYDHRKELLVNLQLGDQFSIVLVYRNIITSSEYEILISTPLLTRNAKFLELLRSDVGRVDFPKLIDVFARYGDDGNKKAAALFEKFWEKSKSRTLTKFDPEMAKPLLRASDEASILSAEPTSTPLDNESECKIHLELSLDTKMFHILALFSPFNVPESWLDTFTEDEVCNGTIGICAGAAMSRLVKSGSVRSNFVSLWINDPKSTLKNTLEKLKSKCRLNDMFLRSFLYLVAGQMALSKREEMEYALHCLLKNLTNFASFVPVSKFLLHMHGTGLCSDMTVGFLKTYHKEVCMRPAGHEHEIHKFEQYFKLQEGNETNKLKLHLDFCSGATAPPGDIQSSKSKPCSSWYNFPPMPSTPSIGWSVRSAELKQLMELGDSTDVRIAVITGMAGSGKSTLSQLFASDYASRRMCKNVVWIDSSNALSITRAFQDLSVELCLSPVLDSDDDPQTTVFRLVKNVYNQLLFSKTLLVFDDAEAFEGPNGIQPFLPSLLLRNAHSPLVIITSRDTSEWHKLPKPISVRLGPLTREQTTEYVIQRFPSSKEPKRTLGLLMLAGSFSWNFCALECAMEAAKDPDFEPPEEDWKIRSQIRNSSAFTHLRLRIQDMFDRLKNLIFGSMAAEILRFSAIVGCEVSVVFILNTISKDTGNMQLRRTFRGALNLLVSQSLAVIREEKLSLNPGFRTSLLAFMELFPDAWLESVQLVYQGIQNDEDSPKLEFIKYMQNAPLEGNSEFPRTVAIAISGMEQLSVDEKAVLPITEASQVSAVTEPRPSSQAYSISPTLSEPGKVSLHPEYWDEFLKYEGGELAKAMNFDVHLLVLLWRKEILTRDEVYVLESIQENDRGVEFIKILKHANNSRDKLKALIQVLQSQDYPFRSVAPYLLHNFVEKLQAFESEVSYYAEPWIEFLEDKNGKS